MRNTSQWIRGITVIAAVIVIGNVIPGLGSNASPAWAAWDVEETSDCYEDIVVSESNAADINGRYVCIGMYHGKPNYVSLSSTQDIFWMPNYGEWSFYDVHTEHWDYAHVSDAATPPSTGWYVYDAPEDSTLPRLSGGGQCSCSAETAIAATAIEGNYLNRERPLAEGDAPLMVDGQPIVAIYEIGETITGNVILLDEDGIRIDSWVGLYIYSLDFPKHSASVKLLDHWMVEFNTGTSSYPFELHTDSYAHGYYDVYLSFPMPRMSYCAFNSLQRPSS